MRWGVAAVLTALVVSSCADGQTSAAPTTSTPPPVSDETVPDPPPTSLATPVSSVPDLVAGCEQPNRDFPPRPGLDMIVRVAMFCGPGVMPLTDVRMIDRIVPSDSSPLSASLDQLLLGLTPAEEANGLGSAFSSVTAGQLRSVEVDDGVAIVDLTRSFVRTNNFSTSNLSGIVGAQIEATVYQFPAITGIDFRVDGERWCWWENTCEGATTPLSTRPIGLDSGPAEGRFGTVDGLLDVRFADAARTEVQVCIVHADPSLGVPTATCGSDQSEAFEAVQSLPYEVRTFETEYYRDDAATSLADVDRSTLPLRPGEESDAVALVQHGLEAFCLHIAEDVVAMRPGVEFPSSSRGNYDDVTEFMVRRFQSLAGIPVDGIYGPLTHELLLVEAVDSTPSNEGCYA